MTRLQGSADVGQSRKESSIENAASCRFALDAKRQQRHKVSELT
jgi:hypothetical protein